MTPALLTRCAVELYGAQWQTPLAADLDVAVRTVQRWAAGQQPVPAGVWPDLVELLQAKAPRCLALAVEIERGGTA